MYDLHHAQTFLDSIHPTACDICMNEVKKRISDRKIDTSMDRWLPKDQVLFFKYKLSTKYTFLSTSSSTKYILQVQVQVPSKLMQV